jgi:hypothetical protein
MQETSQPIRTVPEQAVRTTDERRTDSTPEDQHARRKAELEHRAGRLAGQSRRVSTLRLVTFVGALGLVVARIAGVLPAASLWGAGALLAGFVALVIWHWRLDQAERRAAAGIELHRWALEKLAGRFATYPARGERFASETHPYASDLGIVGEGSLFQLLDGTHTRLGEEFLAGWLMRPSGAAATLERQAAVRDLSARSELRERFAIEGALIAQDKPDPEPFLAWAGAGPSLSALGWVRPLAFALPLLALVGLALVALGILSAGAWTAFLVVQWIVSFSLLGKIEPVATAVSTRQGAFERYRAMLELLEGERFEAPLLVALRKNLDLAPGEPTASRAIRRLSAIVGFLDARSNEVFRFFIGPALLWDVHCVLALEAWQTRFGKSARRWLETIGHVEALSSLAAFAHDHPGHAFPRLADEPTFRARALGHPLLDPRACVRNDVELRGAGTALLVTGSNMSGKSTLLRAMGIALVLAMAGAPVMADELTVSVFELRVSMSAHDSLLRGVSHFYAELEKLKRVVDGIGAGRSLFFLLDEILQGTNSRERFIGARSVLRFLLTHGAMGAASTHDVGLLELEPELDRRLDKVHFEEQVSSSGPGSGAMSFDYQLRPGVVRSTNALRLMKLVGIDVDLE